jgi:hypothetical protein
VTGVARKPRLEQHRGKHVEHVFRDAEIASSAPSPPSTSAPRHAPRSWLGTARGFAPPDFPRGRHSRRPESQTGGSGHRGRAGTRSTQPTGGHSHRSLPTRTSRPGDQTGPASLAPPRAPANLLVAQMTPAGRAADAIGPRANRSSTRPSSNRPSRRQPPLHARATPPTRHPRARGGAGR